MTKLIDTSAFKAPANQPSEGRIVVGILSDGMTMLTEERDGRWHNPVKLLPGGPQGVMTLPMLQAFAGEDFMPAKPEMMLYMSYNVDERLQMIYRASMREMRASKSGLVMPSAVRP